MLGIVLTPNEGFIQRFSQKSGKGAAGGVLLRRAAFRFWGFE